MDIKLKNPILPILEQYFESKEQAYSLPNLQPEALEIWPLRQAVLSYRILDRVAMLIQRDSQYEQQQKEYLETILRHLFNIALPDFIRGIEENPIHHNVQVVESILHIAIREDKPYQFAKVAAILALIHDIGNGYVEPNLRKIKASEIKQRRKELEMEGKPTQIIEEEMARLIAQAKEFRTAHMVEGAKRARKVLAELNEFCAVNLGEPCLNESELKSIVECIEIHDVPSIADYYAELGKEVNRRYLIPLDNQFACVLREADRGWMVSREGLEKDLVDDLRKDRKPDALKKLRHNVERFKEEYQLYLRAGSIPKAQLAEFKGGTLFRTEAGFQLLVRSVFNRLEEILGYRHRVNVAASLGGTKLGIALVFAGGVALEIVPPLDWRQRFKITDDEKWSDALKDGMVSEIICVIGFIDRTLGPDKVGKIGISCKGPLDVVNNEKILGKGKKLTTLPFKDYALERKVRKDLRLRLNRGFKVELIHDGAAAVLGEVAPGGTLEGKKNAVAIIIGTGVGAGILKDGEISHKHLGSIGRYLVWQEKQNPYTFRYADKSKQAPIRNRKKLEALDPPGKHFSERVAGPWLARRVAEECQEQNDFLDSIVTTTGLTREQIEDFVKDCQPSTVSQSNKDTERDLLVGTTEAAKRGCEPAQEFIRSVAEEIGIALAQFIKECRDEEFVKHIVLVSSVAENFGRDVSVKDEDDLFIRTIRQAASNELTPLGVDDNIKKAAEGIRRSSISYEREFLAFSPK